ncbi:sulfurtransferase [Nodosilinea sp. LEGE 07088]|uniref:sulfurtransferase n=1 Tax=Nodosilinea sp. LEGE 07088 TaxID=2777968 RepID=UPI00187ECE46|nr:sulfurtransferase [Nodosilinea sp. LEGE 07088]MBE9141093.1 sulfurtransferase [Nodosilinea sp. LEGE 07088]
MTCPRNLVSTAWLTQHLDDPLVVVVDCRFALADPHQGRQQYTQSHVPGAWYVDLNQDLSGPVQRHGGRHPLPPIEDLTTLLTTIGVMSKGSDSTLVVAYDDSQFAFAARLWWLLRYLGHDNVAVLDGGWGGWVQSGNPVTTAQPEARPGNFIPAQRQNWVVDIDHVRRRQQGSMLIDSRSPERYRGEVEPIDPIAGSIPGAVNYFWQAVSDSVGQMQPPEQLADHWAALDAADEVIVYCGSGVTACVNLLSQTLAGRPMAKLYAGGWSDWCSYLE